MQFIRRSHAGCAVCFAESLCLGKFHSHIRDVFAPLVVRYIDLMESSVAQSVHNGFEKETWQPQGCVRLRLRDSHRSQRSARSLQSQVSIGLQLILQSQGV